MRSAMLRFLLGSDYEAITCLYESSSTGKLYYQERFISMVQTFLPLRAFSSQVICQNWDLV